MTRSSPIGVRFFQWMNCVTCTPEPHYMLCLLGKMMTSWCQFYWFLLDWSWCSPVYSMAGCTAGCKFGDAKSHFISRCIINICVGNGPLRHFQDMFSSSIFIERHCSSRPPASVWRRCIPSPIVFTRPPLLRCESRWCWQPQTAAAVATLSAWMQRCVTF